MKGYDPPLYTRLRRELETCAEDPPKFCTTCGAEVWPLKGTDVLTCKRGHHQPNLWRA